MSERLTRAKEAWGDVPQYVVALIEACDADGSSQSKVARKLDYSGAVISQVINRLYPGDMLKFENTVQKLLMHRTIDCPALGEILEVACLDWQAETKALTSASPVKVRMFKACRRCKRFTDA